MPPGRGPLPAEQHATSCAGGCPGPPRAPRPCQEGWFRGAGGLHHPGLASPGLEKKAEKMRSEMIRGSQTEGNIDTVIFSIIKISLFSPFLCSSPWLRLRFRLTVRVWPDRGAGGALPQSKC